MPAPRPRAAPAAGLLVGAALAALAALAACSGSGHARIARPPPPAPTTAPATPSPPPPARPARHDIGPPGRLSGQQTRPGSPVLAAKIDNTTAARPQAGIRAADVVYVEQVEAGLTRLLALYNTQLPVRIGPVRSARRDNIDLLAQYGPVALGYSGANAAVNADVAASPLVNDGFDAQPAAYVRDPGRSAPHDLMLDPRAVLAARTGAGARDVGLHFDVRRAPQTAPGRIVHVGFPSATLDFSYDRATRKYTLVQDGIPDVDETARPVRVSNVVVQQVQQVESELVDVVGNHTPDNITVGTGAVTVYRDGHAVPGHWSRPTTADPTHWQTLATGAEISLRPGQTWVLLAGPSVAVTTER